MKLELTFVGGLIVAMLSACANGIESEPKGISTLVPELERKAAAASTSPRASMATTTPIPMGEDAVDEPPTPTFTAMRISEWPLFQSTEELEAAVDFVVTAEVMEVTFHTPDDSPTWMHYSLVQLRVEEDWSRSPIAGDKIVLQQPGSLTYQDRDDPPYVVGELYLLFLRRDRVGRGDLRDPPFAEPAVYRVISPHGRYLIQGQQLQTLTTRYRLNQGLDGRTLEAVKDEVALLQEVPKPTPTPWPTADAAGP